MQGLRLTMLSAALSRYRSDVSFGEDSPRFDKLTSRSPENAPGETQVYPQHRSTLSVGRRLRLEPGATCSLR